MDLTAWVKGTSRMCTRSARQDVDGSGERCGHRRNEDGESAVIERLDDEPRNERVLEFDERRHPRGLAAISRHPLCQAADQAVPRKLPEEHDLEALADRAP